MLISYVPLQWYVRSMVMMLRALSELPHFATLSCPTSQPAACPFRLTSQGLIKIIARNARIRPGGDESDARVRLNADASGRLRQSSRRIVMDGRFPSALRHTAKRSASRDRRRLDAGVFDGPRMTPPVFRGDERRRSAFHSNRPQHSAKSGYPSKRIVARRGWTTMFIALWLTGVRRNYFPPCVWLKTGFFGASRRRRPLALPAP